MSQSLSIDQQARILACEAAFGGAIDAALATYPTPSDRIVRRSELDVMTRETDRPVEFLIAWMHRLSADDTVRPLDSDLAVRWPSKPDAGDTALAVRLASETACWYYEIRAALTLTDRLLQHSPPSDELVTGLLLLRKRLLDDRLHSSEFFRSKALPWLTRLITKTAPPEIADLSFLDPHDRWASVVSAAVDRDPDPTRAARALVHLAAPRGSKPSKAWWTVTRALVQEWPGVAPLAYELLDAVTAAETTARDHQRDGWDVPDPFLLTPADELLARGLAWTTSLDRPDTHTFELLGRVALRSAAMVWVVPAHRMLCPKLALAAVDSLMTIESAAARRELTSMLEEVRVPALIRRIGPHLGLEPGQVRQLVANLRTRGPLPRPDR